MLSAYIFFSQWIHSLHLSAISTWWNYSLWRRLIQFSVYWDFENCVFYRIETVVFFDSLNFKKIMSRNIYVYYFDLINLLFFELSMFLPTKYFLQRVFSGYSQKVFSHTDFFWVSLSISYYLYQVAMHIASCPKNQTLKSSPLTRVACRRSIYNGSSSKHLWWEGWGTLYEEAVRLRGLKTLPNAFWYFVLYFCIPSLNILFGEKTFLTTQKSVCPFL